MTLPNFLVIGASRAGTTSLYRYLGAHPEVFLPAIKETNYFAHEGRRDARFPVVTPAEYAALFADAGAARARGEVSPIYLSRSAVAAERIRRELPGVRLVASLRHPAERAFSNYLLHFRQGLDRRPVAEAFREASAYADYVREGGYAARVRDYVERFPRERIRVFLFEDLARDPGAVLRDLFAFLEVDARFRPDTSVRHNPGGIPRRAWLNDLLVRTVPAQALSRRAPAWLRRLGRRVRDANQAPPPTLPAELRARLVAFYRDDVLRLQDLLARDLSAWLV